MGCSCIDAVVEDNYPGYEDAHHGASVEDGAIADADINADEPVEERACPEPECEPTTGFHDAFGPDRCVLHFTQPTHVSIMNEGAYYADQMRRELLVALLDLAIAIFDDPDQTLATIMRARDLVRSL